MSAKPSSVVRACLSLALLSFAIVGRPSPAMADTPECGAFCISGFDCSDASDQCHSRYGGTCGLGVTCTWAGTCPPGFVAVVCYGYAT